MRRGWLIGAVALALAGTAAVAQTFNTPLGWLVPRRPVTIADNLHYVGTQGLSVFLLTTPEGHVLIDGGLPANAGPIRRNIVALGYKPTDIRWLLNTHAHFDHAGGLAELKRVTGAKLAAHRGDVQALQTGTYPGSENVRLFNFPKVSVDRALEDGDTIALGGLTLTAHWTPGHSAGCTSWEIPVTVAGERKTAFLHCSTSVAANRLAPSEQYPGIVADYERSFARLKTQRADIFLAPHAEQFGLDEKLRARRRGGLNPFVDPGELARRNAQSEADFQAALAEQRNRP